MQSNTKIIFFILITLLLVSIVFNIYSYQNPIREEKDNLEFFDNYIIAMNDYHIAMSFFELSSANLDLSIWYVSMEEYYYQDAIDYTDLAKEQITQAKELIIHSQSKLQEIDNIAPNEFYGEEVKNRIEQNRIFLLLIDQYYTLIDYEVKQLYEINYGSETEATRYFNMYNDLVEESNKNLIALSNISQTIDLNWNSNWYPLMEGS